MNITTNFTQNKTDLDNLKRIKWLTRSNKVLDVIERKRSILVKSGEDVEVIEFGPMLFKSAIKIMKSEIESRENPEDRVEMWECTNFEGVYDFDIEKKLLKSRGYNPEESAIWFFCEMFNIPRSMGDIFISELKLSTLEGDETAIKCAKILGLMK